MISLADIHEILQLEQTYSSPLAPCRQAAQSSDVRGQKRWKFLFVFPQSEDSHAGGVNDSTAK